MKGKTLKAGVIILSSVDKNRVGLLYRARQNDWSFPKGHVEKEENAIETMLREIKEETGLEVDILKELPNLEYVNISNEEHVYTKMFFVRSKDDSKLIVEFENDKIEWVPYNEVVEKLSYDNLKEYFTSILPVLNGVIDSK